MIWFLFFMQSALSKLPPQVLTVFQVIPQTQILQDNYTKDRRIHWSSFSSATTNKDKAIEFSEGGVVLCIYVVNGRSIKDYSFIPEEEEILLSPNMAFIVTKPMFHANGVNYLELVEEIRASTDPTFVF